MSKKKDARKKAPRDLLTRTMGLPTAQQSAAEQAGMVELKRRARRELDAFIDSDEGRAREAFKLRLEALRDDLEIKKSHTCIEVLDAFIQCVALGWGAPDSDKMMRVLAPYFDRLRAQKGGEGKREKGCKGDVREHWDSWQQEPGRYKNVTKFSHAMHDKFDLNPDVVLRWCRVWKKETAT